jgi:hypothetical protein
MFEEDNAEKMFDAITGWVESADTMDLEELRQIRRAMGDDVEESERGFLSMLGKLKAEAEGKSPAQHGIGSLLGKARQLGLDAPALADKTGLSVVLVTKLDRRLINCLTVPKKVLEVLANALRATSDAISAYLEQPPALATEGRFRAKENPRTQKPQDFFEAVQTDKSISEERRANLLALEESEQ